MVTVGTAVEGMSGVLVDNVEVGRQATQHLLDLGHRRIAFFGDDLDEMHGFTAAVDRHRGYDLTLREAGIEPDPALVNAPDSRWTVARPPCIGCSAGVEGPRPADRRFRRQRRSRHGRSLRRPAAWTEGAWDLSIVGVDGHDFAYLFDLTTISQPVRDQGRIAARLLLEQVNSPNPARRRWCRSAAN